MSRRVGQVLEAGQDPFPETNVALRVRAGSFKGDVLGVLRPEDGGWSITPAELVLDGLSRGTWNWPLRSLAARLAEAARRADLDVLQVEAASALAPAAAVAAAETGLPLVATFLGGAMGTLRSRLPALLVGAGAWVCPSETTERLVQRVLAPPCPVAVIRPHVPQGLAGLRAPRLGPAEPRVVHPGDLEAGPESEALARACRRAGALLVPAAGSAGDRRRSMLAGQAVAVFSGRAEGSPALLVEALASGRPVVASRVPGHEELLSGGREGLLADTEADWVRALRQVLGDPREAGLRARRAARRVREEHSAERARQAWLELYEGL